MIVDGHVGKVFSRTGLLDTVEHVKDTTQIHAQKMREQIEEVVASVPDAAPFYVDDGAFYLYENGFGTDLEPKCRLCPIGDTCLQYTYWTAFAKTQVASAKRQKTEKRS